MLIPQQILAYANISAPELRTRGVPEQIIQFVEVNRGNLQRTLQQQSFRSMAQKQNMPGQVSESGRMNPDVLGPFSNILPPQQPGSIPSGGSRPPPSQGHPSAGMNVAGTSNGQPQTPQKQPQNNGMPPMQASRPSRPTAEESQEALQFIQRTKSEFIAKSKHPILLALLLA